MEFSNGIFALVIRGSSPKSERYEIAALNGGDQEIYKANRYQRPSPNTQLSLIFRQTKTN